MKNILYALTSFALLLAASGAFCQANLTFQTLPFSQNWSNTGLITTNNVWTDVPGITGYRGDDASTTTAGVDPQTILNDRSGTPLSVLANQSAATSTSGANGEFEISDPVVGCQGSGTADAPHLVIRLNTTGFTNIVVSYNLRDIDASTDNTNQQFALHYRLGATGDYTNVPAAYVADATSGPSQATLVTPVNVTLPAAAGNQAQLEIRILTTNAPSNDEWVGIDDISVTGTPTASCNISGITAANFSTCNDNGTAAPGDDFFTADVTVNFMNPPASGTLDLSGDGMASVAVGSLGSATSHTFTGVVFSADGLSMVVNASFSAEPGCQLTGVTVGTALSPCSSAPVCSVANIEAADFSACDDNGTPFASDDFFIGNVTVEFQNPPATGNLVLSGSGSASVPVSSLVGNSHEFIGVVMPANGGMLSFTAEFSDEPTCTFSANNIATAPAACSCGLLINEADYDQVGTDNAEFIELYNPCGSAINLDDYSVELVNGSGGGAAVYSTVNLPNENLAAGGYYVICALGSSTANCDTMIFSASGTLQNGAPDAIGLKFLTSVVDALSYEGNTGAPYTEGTGTSAADDNTTAGIGLSRFPNGTDTGNNNADFSIRCITPGAANSASTSGCVAAVCSISNISVGNVSACNSHNTSDPGDDTFTADVTVTFANPPATGTLDLTGDGTGSVAVTGLTTTHTFTGVTMDADGGSISLTASFSADGACNFSNANAGSAPAACSVCGISDISVGNVSVCDSKNTADPGDDTFTADVTVTFANPPATGTLDLSGDGTGSVAVTGLTTTHTFTGVTMSADGGSISLSAAFSADAACNFANANAGSAPAACSACGISGISVGNISACNSQGTSNPADDTFTADVTVTFANPPATGNLNLTGDPIFSPVSVPVGSLSGTTHTFTGVVFSADGTAIVLNAFFSADAGCTFTNSNAGMAPGNCSGTVCTVSGVSVSGISACNDNGTPFESDDFFTANVTVTFANPPGSGALNLTGDGVATVAVGNLGSATSHTFTGVMMSADGGNISLSATFSADSGCTFTNENAGAAPASCSCGLKINEVDYDQVGADNAEFIELYNPCGSAQNLDNYSVELVNGSGGGAAVYKTIDLPNVNLAAGGYFVICANGANTSNCDLDVTPDADLIQNGAPDAIGLKYLTIVVDALSYEGNAAAPYLEGTGTSAFDDNTTAGIGLSRFPNGSDSNNNTADFSIRCITPGAANSASTSGCVAVCNISAVTLGSPSACNGNGTSNPADDTFTANVTVNFANPPASGNLRLTGDPVFSPIEVPVSSLSGNSHTFTGVVFAADGGAVNLIASFTADAGCTLTNSNAGTAPSACSCNISALTASNISDCEDQGTSTPTDDRFTADVTVTFANPPASGNLLVTGDPIFSPVTVAVGSLGSPTSHTFNNVQFSADGTAINLNAFFSADATCAASNSNAGTAPEPCSPCEITSVSMANASGCNSNGTPNPADDFFTADVTVTFFSKPGTGNLVLSGNGSASAPVGAIGSFSHTFTGVQMPANGSTVNLTALFSENAACILTNPAAGVAPVSCSPCGITGISVSNISACDDQGTSDPLDDTFTADVTVSFFNPPASGTLDLSGDGSASTGSFGGNSYTFTGVTMSANGGAISLTAAFSANSACTFTNNNAGAAPPPCSGTCFVAISNLEVNDETCPGAGDGSLVISATGSGQLAYSIDGGATYNLTGIFNLLSPGTYPVLVWVQGDPTCSASASVTVNPAPPGNLKTWYKDLDGDLFSDGVTIVACAQPAGFQLAEDLEATSGDCDDSDPNELPNQTWYKDSDGDGYSNGAVMIQCTRPFGFKTAAELIATTGDCNDNNGSIHPGAPEICNGLDDDCDGQVDEGATGGLTFNGSVTFTSQAQVNAFSQCYSVIAGNMTIQNAGITSLSNLSNLEQVNGNVTIKWTSLTNPAGLDNLAGIGGNLLIFSNNNGNGLASLDGLEGLDTVGGNLKIYYNFDLSDCCAIEDLLESGGVGGTISIYQNEMGCDNVSQITQTCNGGGNIILPPGGNGQAAIFEELPQLEIYPNPTSGRLNIQLSGKLSEGELLLHDTSGRLLWRQATDEKTSEYGFEKGGLNLLPGLYLLEWRHEGGRNWRRLAVQ